MSTTEPRPQPTDIERELRKGPWPAGTVVVASPDGSAGAVITPRAAAAMKGVVLTLPPRP
ncbi:MAG: hypothetical protein EKK55_24515 [Rhodocyclaceae bacterium]|nr:MAG: hypothetical protein EKK55_24515 [Rhodocyclaceae bacterium]